MIIRLAREENLQQWLAIAREVGPIMRCPDMAEDPAFLTYAKRKLAQGDAYMAIYEDSGVHGPCAGFIGLSIHFNRITWLGVAQAYWRRGVASALVRQAFSVLDCKKPITVNTYPNTYAPGHAARALYFKHGFREVDGTVFWEGLYEMVTLTRKPEQSDSDTSIAQVK